MRIPTGSKGRRSRFIPRHVASGRLWVLASRGRRSRFIPRATCLVMLVAVLFATQACSDGTDQGSTVVTETGSDDAQAATAEVAVSSTSEGVVSSTSEAVVSSTSEPVVPSTTEGVPAEEDIAKSTTTTTAPATTIPVTEPEPPTTTESTFHTNCRYSFNIANIDRYHLYHPDLSFSPNGSHIVVRDTSDNSVYVGQAGSSNICKLEYGAFEECYSNGKCARNSYIRSYIWSPKGDQVLLHVGNAYDIDNSSSSSSSSPEIPTELLVVQADGSNIRSIIPDSNPNSVEIGSWSPNGSQILIWQDNYDSDDKLYIAQSDASQLHQLPTGDNLNSKDNIYLQFGPGQHAERQYFEMIPPWSPDGSKVLFVADHDGDQEIYTIDINGEDIDRYILNKLTDNDTSDFSPTWSPDGTRISYLSESDEELEPSNKPYNFVDLYVIEPDGYDARQLTNGLFLFHGSSWSPDGSQILLTAGIGPGFTIYSLPVDGSGPQYLADSFVGPLHHLSPDGSYIMFNSHNVRTDNNIIHVVAVDGTRLRKLTAGDMDTCCLEWSPDGSQILFQEWDTTTPEIYDYYIMRADGSDIRKLTHPRSYIEDVG